MLWQTWNAPPPVAEVTTPLVVEVEAESSGGEPVVVAVIESGTGPMVVGVPWIVVSIGVTVEGNPLASTETQGSDPDSVPVVK